MEWAGGGGEGGGQSCINNNKNMQKCTIHLCTIRLRNLCAITEMHSFCIIFCNVDIGYQYAKRYK